MYLDVILDQLHITDADALLLPDQKSRRNKKQQRFNVPAQDPSIARFQQSTAGSATPADSQASNMLLLLACAEGSVITTTDWRLLEQVL